MERRRAGRVSGGGGVCAGEPPAPVSAGDDGRGAVGVGDGGDVAERL